MLIGVDYVAREQTVNKYPDGALERLQDVERELLVEFDRVCRANNLTYFLDGGTCLGAVRHGGFIPWDDDVDVGMPLDDYQSFLEIAPHELRDGVSLHTCSNTVEFPAFWAKLYADNTRFIEYDFAGTEHECAHAIFLDIFPYSVLDSDEAVADKQVKWSSFFQKLSYTKAIRKPSVFRERRPSLIVRIAYAIAHTFASVFVPQSFIRAKFISNRRTSNPGELWSNLSGPSPIRHRRDILVPPKEIDFDGVSVFAPADTDAYLKNVYGEYMEVPPPEKRHTHTPVVLDLGDGVDLMGA